MNRPPKICKNPECQKEYTDYKSAKSEFCCPTCTQRAGYLRRKKQNKYFHDRNLELKEQYEIVKFISQHVKKPIPSEILDLFELKFDLFDQIKDENGRPTYIIKNKKIMRDLNDPNYINIKTIIRVPKK